MTVSAKPSMTGSRGRRRRADSHACVGTSRLSSIQRSEAPWKRAMLDKPEVKVGPALLARFAAIVGEKNAITDPQAQEPYLVEMRNLFHGHTPAVLRPSSVDQVSQILKLANETTTPIVPQGGNTGLVGGQIPLHNEIVLSLNRLDRIREVD